MASSLPEALVGLWCNASDGGRRCWAWDEFLPDGTLHMCGVQEGDPRPFSAVAAVSFSGRRMCYQVMEATDNFWIRPGQRYCTEIVVVEPHRHVYRDLDTGESFELLRKPASQKSCG